MDKRISSKGKKGERKKRTIKSMDISQRPREILLARGKEKLSDEQLLAILIDTGTRDKNAIEIAEELIHYAGNLSELAKFDVVMLQDIKGIGPSKACKIAAALEFAKRVVESKPRERISVNSPKVLVDMFCMEFDTLNVEVFKLVCLNVKNNVIYAKNITKGLVDACLVDTKEIFKEALLRQASAIIIMHNHPTQNPKPSQEDFQVTQRVLQAGQAIGIPLLDHIIYGTHKRYYSFKENGYI